MGTSFTRKLILEKLNHSRLWRVHREFEYHVGKYPSNDIIKIPRGFQTDLASTPQITWVLFPPDGRYTQAAVVHDYLYHVQTRTRRAADQIFYEAMTILGVPLLTRKIMYRAVRLAGWLPWKKHRKNIDTKQIEE